MKKWLKIITIFFALIVSVTIFSACDVDTDLGTVPPPKVELKPTELKVTGYVNEIEVGEEFITKLKVKQLIDGTWYEVPKADYVYTCEYQGFKYGEYSFNVYLRQHAGVTYTDTIVVTPKKVEIPSEYSVSYTGQLIDIKSYFDGISQGKYEVISYANRSQIGDYSVILTLNNSDEYVWVNESGEIIANPVVTVNWSITE